MKVTSERQENCQVRVTVELDAAEAENKLRQTAQRLSRRYTVPGYRKGKAPYAAVLRAFGRELLQEQALEEFGQELYDQALKEVEYKPYAPGELEKVEWDPFRLEILLPIMPEVDLGDYRAVRATPEPKPVADDAVDHYLEELRQQHTQWIPVERPADLGDHVVVDIEGRAGDQEVGPEGADQFADLPGGLFNVLGEVIVAAGDRGNHLPGLSKGLLDGHPRTHDPFLNPGS